MGLERESAAAALHSGAMKLNLANPATGCQKQILVDDESKLVHLFDKRISAEIDGELLGDEFKGYVFKIMGGNGKDGFGMKQGVLVPGRVKLLMPQGDSGFRGHGRRNGERRRKGC